MIAIEYQGKQPIYEQIAERFRDLILCGALRPGEKLPSVRTLAMELSINPNTIQRAFALLEREGFIYSLKGVGNFVGEDVDFQKKQKERLFLEFESGAKKCMDHGIRKKELIQRIENIFGEVES